MFQLYFNLGESIPNLTDWIQAFSALGVLALTGLMAYYAKQALKTWRHQEKHKVTMLLIQHSQRTHNLISNLRNIGYDTLSSEQKGEILKNYPNSSFLILKSENLNSKLKMLTEQIDKIEELKLSAISSLPEDNELRRYYQFISETIHLIKQKSVDYSIIVHEFENSRTNRNNYASKQNQVNKLDEHRFLQSDFVLDYSSLNEAVKDINKEAEEAIERYNHILKTRRDLEDFLFRSVFYSQNQLDLELIDKYEKATLYIHSYQT